MAHEKLRGIILRLVSVKDYDRYLTILTRGQGVLSVYAKSARRPKNPLASRCQLFSFADFYLFKNKDRYSLNDAELVYSFTKLQSDILRLSAASQLAALIIDHVHAKEESEPFYELFIRACHELDRGEKDPYMITWLAQMKMMNFMGYQPVLDACVETGAPASGEQHLWFDYRNAGVLSERAGRAAAENYERSVSPLSRGLWQVLCHLETCPVERTFAMKLPVPLIDELGKFTLKYLSEHLDKSYDKFSSFRDFYLPPEAP